MHSVRMVFGNLKQVLQITVVPAITGFALIVGMFVVSGVPLEAIDGTADVLPASSDPGAVFLLILSLAMVAIFVGFWIVVSWHRFILLEEYPRGIVPPFRFDRILAYLGQFLLLILILSLASFPMLLLLGVTVDSSPILSFILVAIYVIFLILGFYRMAIILPSAAIGKTLRLTDAWAATSNSNGAIIVLVIVSGLFQTIIQLVFTALLFIPILGILLVLFASLLILPLINVSILTTMYGVFVEKRELS